MLKKLSFFQYSDFTLCSRKPSNVLGIPYSERPLMASSKLSFHPPTFLSLQCATTGEQCMYQGTLCNCSARALCELCTLCVLPETLPPESSTGNRFHAR